MIYKPLLRYFTKVGMKYMKNYFLPLKSLIKKSNLSIVFDLYVGKMIFFSVLVFILTLIGSFILGLYLGLEILILVLMPIATSVALAVLVFVLFHSYPFQVFRANKRSIEANMAFTINHMAAIASSGVPPYIMFKLIGSIKEYGEVSKECARVVRNMDIFGMDITTSVKNVASRTASTEFKKFLQNIVSIIETGGNLKKSLESSAKDSMFDYKLKRESYVQTLSTYADIYTAVLIAAPLFFVSVLSIMALVGGEIFGLDIPTALRLGIYGAVPLLNLIFLFFIHYTQPTM
ncbi:type II secretion system F family protein [Candidatus Aenigmatarchaeota archaeon]